MLLGIQFIGLLFALIMLYFTYTNYKRKNYQKDALLVWSGLWIAMGIIFIIPEIFYGVMNFLNINRTADFFTATALVFLTSITFRMYITVKKVDAKVEQVVRKVALEKAKK